MFKYLAFLLIAISALAQTDGPAVLPTRIPSVVIVSPNPPKIVATTENLQTVVGKAVCGDTFLLDPALVYSGSLTIPTLACDAAHGITIKSSATIVEDAKHRPLIGQQFPRIILKGSQTVSGGAFVSWYGVRFTRLPGTGTIYNYVNSGSNAVYDHVIFTGTATDETVRGLYLGGAHDVVVQNSVFLDFHCKALGTCGDSQAILGGIGDKADSGSYLIQNNLIESAGENVMMGGGVDSFNVSDVTIQYNDIVKPASWNPADPSFTGTKWIVKNLVEFKNCVRCLVQGNRMIGSWGGYTQIGFGLLIGAKNQGSATGGQCPMCAVTDIVIRDNWISRTGEAMQIMRAPSGTGDYPADQGHISIHDNVFDQLQYPECYQCGRWLVQLSSDNVGGFVMHDVAIRNNTFSLAGYLNGGGFMDIGGPATGLKMTGIAVVNNVFPGGQFPLYSIGGGAGNCFASGTLDYAGSLAGCGVTFTGNVVLNNGNTQKIIWPTGNYVVSSGADMLALQKSLATQIQ